VLTVWPVFGSARSIPERLDLCLAIENIQNWLEECNEDHPSCSSASILPRRVLDLETQNHQIAARLIESDGLKDKYVALSHCWGGDPSLTITTTTATIRERQSEIAWEELPQTFRDAIIITKGLGVRYLWIDSLCIIQQDMLDWEQESSKMASTYSNCYLNLAATHARNGNGGCLSSRWTPSWTMIDLHSNINPFQRRPVTSHEIFVGGKATGVYVRNSLNVAHAQCTSDLAHDFPLEQTAPLLSRAWCYQERLLSPRTVNFHSSEMIWHCMEAVSCECGSLDNANADIEYLGRATFPKYTFRTLGNDSSADSAHSGFQIALWLNIVHQYSKMRLTDPNDLLPALGGVAHRFKQRVNPGRYLAGLWENELAMCLLWQVYSHPEVNPSRIYVDTRRLPKYRAPSWSWASIDFDPAYRSAVSYYEVLNYGYEMHPDFSVVSASADLAGSNEFGRVVGGMLRLRCLVIHGFLDRVLSTIALRGDEDNWPRLLNVSSAERLPISYDVNLDCIEHMLPLIPNGPVVERLEIVKCLLVGNFSADGCKVAVIVKETGAPGIFERAGYMTFDFNASMAEITQLEEVNIV
jgi:hypothetical protein